MVTKIGRVQWVRSASMHISLRLKMEIWNFRSTIQLVNLAAVGRPFGDIGHLDIIRLVVVLVVVVAIARQFGDVGYFEFGTIRGRISAGFEKSSKLSQRGGRRVPQDIVRL